MRVFNEFRLPLLLQMLVLFAPVAVTARCNPATEYRCSNSKCIPRSKVNNTINDCDDNSDEASIPCRSPLFSCRNNRCALAEWVLDGKDDCLDGSDETKYIGTNCSSAVSCCFCYDYVPHSSCGVDDRCRCDDGFHPNEMGTVCTKNALGNRCDRSVDCFSAIDNSSCVSGFCACDMGHYASLDQMQCVRKKIRDDCRIDDDCSSVIAESTCQSGRCFCRFGFKVVRNESACIPMQISDRTCERDEDCEILFSHTVCQSHHQQHQQQLGSGNGSGSGICRCASGRFQLNGSMCQLRRIFDPCQFQSDCSDAIPHSTCSSSNNSSNNSSNSSSIYISIPSGDSEDDSSSVCICSSGFVVEAERTRCRRRRIADDECQMSSDCSDAIPNSHCAPNGLQQQQQQQQCVCDLGYRSHRGTNSCVSLRIGDSCQPASADCETVIPSSHCVDGSCVCLSGHTARSNGTFCERVRIGSTTCRDSIECSRAVEKSICNNGTCVCQSGYWNSNGNDDDDNDYNASCIRRRIGDNSRCNLRSDCNDAVPNSSCINDTCLCIPGFISTNNGAICVRRRIAEHECRTDVDCSAAVSNSRCLLGFCHCTTGYFPSTSNSVCTLITIGDGDCQLATDCSDAIADSECTNGKCQCRRGYIKAESSRTSCRLRRIFDAGCRLSEECSEAVGNSHCNDGQCVCDIGFVPGKANRVCDRRRLGDNSTCERTDECKAAVNDSECRNAECVCMFGYRGTLDGDDCQLRFIGTDRCRIDEDCVDLFLNSECINSTCICQSGYHLNIDFNSCIIRKIGDDTCQMDSDCYDAVNNSGCRNGTCLCLRGYKSIEDNTTCQLLTLGDSCSEDIDCESAIRGSVCSGGACQCTIGFKETADRVSCVHKQLGDVCLNDADCEGPVRWSFCSGGRCTCVSGYVETGKSDCRRRRVGGDSVYSVCSVDSDCRDAVALSECTDSVCHCIAGHFVKENGTVCQRRNIHELEKGCIANVDCSRSFNHSFCHNDTRSCRCAAGYVTTTGLECDARRIDDWCDVTSECTDVIPSSHCVNGICRCDVGHVVAIDRSSCIKRKIGENMACETTQDCNSVIRQSDCHNGVCLCNRGYHAYSDDSTCLTIGDYMTCAFTTQNCSNASDIDSSSSGCYEAVDQLCKDRFQHTTCLNSTCLCRSGYHLYDDVHSCIIRKIGDDTCQIDSDCYDAVNNSGCQNGTCLCLRGYKSVEDNTTCQLLTLGDSCSDDLDCETAINSSFCGNGSCLCLSGYNESFVSGRADCKRRRIGDATCTIDTDCYDAVTFSECVKNVCLCGIDFLPTENGTICKNRTVLRQFDRQLIEEFRNCSVDNESSCFCPAGFARRHQPLEEENCHRAKGFFVQLNCSSIVGRYEWFPLRFNRSFTSSESYDFWHYTWRLQHSGMDEIILRSSLNRDFLSTRILQFSDAKPGVEVKFAVFFLPQSSVTGNELSDTIRNYFISSETELGQSRINVSSSFLHQVGVRDLNECLYSGNASLLLQLNDCDPKSVCSNTVGYFECVCGLDYKDETIEAEFKGRNCTAIERDKERQDFEKSISSAGCTNGKCDTPWDLVITITIGTFTLLLLLLIVEVVSQTKHVRKLLAEKRKRKSLSVRRMTMMPDSEQLLSASASLSVDNEMSKCSNDTATAGAGAGGGAGAASSRQH